MENKEQQYKNLTLISINNTLHIKADNLEAVEVDSSCVDGILLSIDHKIPQFSLSEGINISELSDRIEVKDTCEVPECVTHNCKMRAFLISEATYKKITELRKRYDPINPNPPKSYTIEEIEKALNKTNICHYDKLEVLNNLKK